MKILVTGHSMGHPRQRKMWEYIAHEMNHKVVVVVPPAIKDEINNPIVEGNFQLLPLPVYGSKFPNMWFIPAMHEVVEEFKPDVIVCIQEPWEYHTYNCAKIAELYDIPFVFFTWENLPKYLPQPLRAMDAAVTRDAKLAVGGNNEAARILIQKGAKTVNAILQTGLDEMAFVPTPEIKFDDKKEPKKLLYIGRLVEEKGIGVILEAFDSLNGDYILKIVGGRGTPELEEKIKTHPEFGKKITLENWVNYDEMPRAINWADIVLMPSVDTQQWKEQCGYIIGEALLCHKPVITSLSSSIIEIWNLPDVYFVSQGDVHMLAHQILSIKNFTAKDGRKAVIEKYSLKAVGELWVKALEEIV